MEKQEIKAKIQQNEDEKDEIFTDYLHELMQETPDKKYLFDLETHYRALIYEIKSLNRRLRE